MDPSSGTISLQALNSHSISGVIRQLSSLARHAESIMGDIADILASYYVRTATLEERSKRLMAEILPALDPDQEGEKMCTREYTIHVLRVDVGIFIYRIRGQLSEWCSCIC